MANEKRLIDAKPLMEDGWHLVKTGKSNAFLASMSLADVPTVDAVEVVHGKWIVLDDDYVGKPCYCSNCHEHFYIARSVTVEKMRERNKYCFNCGAKMDGGNEDG